MLQVQELYKSYGDRSILQGLNLTLQPGELYGLLGPNGAGKTTTINILCRLLNADKGTVLVNDQPLSEKSKRWIGIAPQENLLYRSLTCAEHLAFFSRLYGLPKVERKNRITSCLEAVGLGSRAGSVAETLSGGMQRRLSIAIALIHQPKLLILDEPTTGLDVEARHDLWELIRTLQRQGMTILLTTHLLDEAERLCQRIGILQQGKILAEGTLDQLRQYIPAQELVVVQTDAKEQAIARGQELGWTHRFYAGDLTFWLPKPLELTEILNCFQGVELKAIARQPIRLEHLYLEITQRK